MFFINTYHCSLTHTYIHKYHSSVIVGQCLPLKVKLLKSNAFYSTQLNRKINPNKLICYFLKHSFMRNPINPRNPIICWTNDSRENGLGNPVISLSPSPHIRIKPTIFER